MHNKTMKHPARGQSLSIRGLFREFFQFVLAVSSALKTAGNAFQVAYQSAIDLRENSHESQHPTQEVEVLLPQPALTIEATVPFWETQGFWAHLDSFLKTQNSPHTQRAYETDLVDFL